MTWDSKRHAAAKVRCQEACEGPWGIRYGRPLDEHILYQTGTSGPIAWFRNWWPQTQVDADFIAHARTDLPDALVEIERLQAELRSQWIVMKDALDSLNEDAPETTAELLQQQLVLSIDYAPEEATT